MEADVKATDGAKVLAEEKGIDLASVDGTGSGGQVTKGDVEQAAGAQASGADAGAADVPAEQEQMVLAEFNENLGDLDKLVLYDSEGNAHTLLVSNPSTRVMTASQFEDLNQAKHAPTAAYPNGFKYLKRGRRIG